MPTNKPLLKKAIKRRDYRLMKEAAASPRVNGDGPNCLGAAISLYNDPAVPSSGGGDVGEVVGGGD
jgi:hypothetical protein